MTTRNVTGLTWNESDDTQPVVHTFARAPLNVRPGSFSRVYSFTAESGAMSSRRVGSGRAMVAMTVRFDRSSKHLAEALRYQKGGKVTFWRRAPAIESYPSRLVETGDVTWVPPDPDRYGFGEYQLDIVLRAQTSTLSYEPLYSPWLFRWKHGESIRNHTFTRDDAALYVDGAGVYQSAAANILRSQHYVDGTPYALHEPGATNLATQSESFDHADWTETSVDVTADARSAPDGTTTAEQVTVNTGGAGSENARVHQDVASLSGTATVSVHIRDGDVGNDSTTLAVRDDGGSGTLQRISCALISGATATDAGSPTAHGSVELGGGWWRFWMTVDLSGFTGTPRFEIDVNRSATNEGDTIYLWGAQAENGRLSSYIATTTASVARDDDTHTPSLSGLGIDSPQIWKDGGVFYLSALHLGMFFDTGALRIIFAFGTTAGASGTDNEIRCYVSSANVLTAEARVGGSIFNSTLGSAEVDTWEMEDRVSLAAEIVSDSGQHRIRLHWKRNDGDWTSATASSLFTLPESWTGDLLTIAQRGDGNAGGRLGVDRLALFDRTLTATKAAEVAGG